MLVLKGIVYSVLFLLEISALVAFSYWGFHVEGTKIVKLLMGIGAPVIVAIFWGSFVAPKAKFRVSGLAWIVLKILVFGLATLALYVSNQQTLAYTFAAIVVVELFLVHGIFEK